MQKWGWLLALGALGLMSCTTFRLEPVAGDGVEVRQDRGTAKAVRSGPAAVVEASADWGSELRFVVSVQNQSGKTLALDSDAFEVWASDGVFWDRVPLIPSEKVYDRAQKFSAAATAFVAVGTIASVSQPVERPRTTTTTTVIGTGSGSSVVIVQSSQQSEIDVEATNRRNAERIEAAGRFSRDSQSSLADLKGHLFFRVDLEAGKSYEGWVYAEGHRGVKYKLVVPVDGQKYELLFNKVKARD